MIIRTLHNLKDLNTAVDLQRVYWGDNMADLVSTNMLLSISRYGGHVHAAFDDDKMVGLLIGFLGADINPDDRIDAPSHIYVMSKRMVVHPDYRGQKIGEELKQAQRQFAVQHNIQLVLWTFDPLLSRNAYLNLHKLGAVGQKYEKDYFGSDADNPVLSADRLQVNWWVKHPSLDNRKSLNPENLPTANTVSFSKDGLLMPHQVYVPKEQTTRLEIPMNFSEVQEKDTTLAQAWRDHIREAFLQLLSVGYIATDFVRQENRVFYIFTQDDGTYTFQ